MVDVNGPIGRRLRIGITDFTILETLNEFGAPVIAYHVAGAPPDALPLAVVQGAVNNAPGDPCELTGYVVQGFDLSEPGGRGFWIFDLGEYGQQALAFACQQAIESIRDLLPLPIPLPINNLPPLPTSDPGTPRFTGFSPVKPY